MSHSSKKIVARRRKEEGGQAIIVKDTPVGEPASFWDTWPGTVSEEGFLFPAQRAKEIDRLLKKTTADLSRRPELEVPMSLGKSETKFEYNGDHYNVTKFNPTSPVLCIERTHGPRRDFCEINSYTGTVIYAREIEGQDYRVSRNSRWAIKCFEQMVKDLSSPPAIAAQSSN